MNILFLSNAYDGLTLLPYLHLLFNNNISIIYVSSEIFGEELKTICKSTVIVITSDIFHCIDDVDLVFSINLDEINSNVKRVIKYACSKSIKVLNVDTRENKKNTIVQDKRVTDKPSIMLISTGMYTQVPMTELAIVKLMLDNNIEFHYYPSDYVMNVIMGLKQNCLLNEKVAKSLLCDIIDSQLVFISNETDIFGNKETDFCSKYKPDIIVLNTNEKIGDIGEIITSVQYRYDLEINYIFESNFVPIGTIKNDPFPVYIRTSDNSENVDKIYFDCSFVDRIFNDIFLTERVFKINQINQINQDKKNNY